MRRYGFIAMVAVLAGCAGSPQPTGYMGQFTVVRDTDKSCRSSIETRCTFDFTLLNNKRSPNNLNEPVIRVVATDCQGKSLEERRLYFDTIARGERQTKPFTLKTQKDGRVRIQAISASSGWRDAPALNGVVGPLFSNC